MSSGSYFPPPVRAVSIPKKSGGERILGVPTVADRVAQTVVKQLIEPDLDPIFLANLYGYRPRKSALDAVGVTRERCWRYDWILEFDIKGLFDNVDHELLLRAVRKHVQCKWALLYIERWLKAPMEREDGTTVERTRGTPQGGVVRALFVELRSMLIDDDALIRAIHVLALVHWIGGLAVVTTIVLPHARGLPNAKDAVASFEAFERRFAFQARISVMLVGLSGAYMLTKLDAWNRFQYASFWWLDLMVVVWMLFALMIYVLEPLAVHRTLPRIRSTQQGSRLHGSDRTSRGSLHYLGIRHRRWRTWGARRIILKGIAGELSWFEVEAGGLGAAHHSAGSRGSLSLRPRGERK